MTRHADIGARQLDDLARDILLRDPDRALRASPEAFVDAAIETLLDPELRASFRASLAARSNGSADGAEAFARAVHDGGIMALSPDALAEVLRRPACFAAVSDTLDALAAEAEAIVPLSAPPLPPDLAPSPPVANAGPQRAVHGGVVEADRRRITPPPRRALRLGREAARVVAFDPREETERRVRMVAWAVLAAVLLAVIAYVILAELQRGRDSRTLAPSVAPQADQVAEGVEQAPPRPEDAPTEEAHEGRPSEGAGAPTDPNQLSPDLTPDGGPQNEAPPQHDALDPTLAPQHDALDPTLAPRPDDAVPHMETTPPPSDSKSTPRTKGDRDTEHDRKTSAKSLMDDGAWVAGEVPTKEKTSKKTRRRSRKGSESLSKKEIFKVIRAFTPKMEVNCLRYQPPPKVRVRFNVEPSGSVSDVAIDDEEASSSAAGKCIAKEVAGMRFPTHGGEPKPVVYTFRF